MAAIIAQLTRNFAEGVEILNALTLNSATAASGGLCNKIQIINGFILTICSIEFQMHSLYKIINDSICKMQIKGAERKK